MQYTFDQISQGLAALQAKDFDYHTPGFNGNERLDQLTSELLTLPQPERGIRALFDVMERMPEADLGSPGPLVHTLEKMRGQYENELVDSIKRKPTPLAVWMVNRILNAVSAPDQRSYYLGILRLAASHPAAAESAKLEAREFIQFQEKRG